MDMYNPKEWTPDFVRENSGFCFGYINDTKSGVAAALRLAS